ncbi:unnamed protein product [Amoebophrya sp. A25]|nr:unnamed protein product [Amoebophrya sp. A25]|eukprot:GSA25T00016406001.1
MLIDVYIDCDKTVIKESDFRTKGFCPFKEGLWRSQHRAPNLVQTTSRLTVDDVLQKKVFTTTDPYKAWSNKLATLYNALLEWDEVVFGERFRNGQEEVEFYLSLLGRVEKCRKLLLDEDGPVEQESTSPQELFDKEVLIDVNTTIRKVLQAVRGYGLEDLNSSTESETLVVSSCTDGGDTERTLPPVEANPHRSSDGSPAFWGNLRNFRKNKLFKNLSTKRRRKKTSPWDQWPRFTQLLLRSSEDLKPPMGGVFIAVLNELEVYLQYQFLVAALRSFREDHDREDDHPEGYHRGQDNHNIWASMCCCSYSVENHADGEDLEDFYRYSSLSQACEPLVLRTCSFSVSPCVTLHCLNATCKTSHLMSPCATMREKAVMMSSRGVCGACAEKCIVNLIESRLLPELKRRAQDRRDAVDRLKNM